MAEEKIESPEQALEALERAFDVLRRRAERAEGALAARQNADDGQTVCPQCGSGCECEMVDVGVGEIPCGPWRCVDCGWVEERPALPIKGDDPDRIHIRRSTTADTRTCDFANVSKEQLRLSSIQHIEDVRAAIGWLARQLYEAGRRHDEDKITDLDTFHRDFLTGFTQTEWWDRHRRITRHHLFQPDGIPKDVTLLDVLELVADCVMAGMGRSGTVSPLTIEPDLLMAAFRNTVSLLKEQVVVDDDEVPR